MFGNSFFKKANTAAPVAPVPVAAAPVAAAPVAAAPVAAPVVPPKKRSFYENMSESLSSRIAIPGQTPHSGSQPSDLTKLQGTVGDEASSAANAVGNAASDMFNWGGGRRYKTRNSKRKSRRKSKRKSRRSRR